MKRSNAQSGDAEIWTAQAANTLTNVTVTLTPATGGYDEQMTVLSFKGAGGTGASAANAGASGAPTVNLTVSAAGSLAYATGNDWDRATGRTVGTGQALVAQWIDTGSGDTYWTQDATAATTGAGQAVTLNDTAPTGDHWNLAAVEVLLGRRHPDADPHSHHSDPDPDDSHPDPDSDGGHDAADGQPDEPDGERDGVRDDPGGGERQRQRGDRVGAVPPGRPAAGQPGDLAAVRRDLGHHHGHER